MYHTGLVAPERILDGFISDSSGDAIFIPDAAVVVQYSVPSEWGLSGKTVPNTVDLEQSLVAASGIQYVIATVH